MIKWEDVDSFISKFCSKYIYKVKTPYYGREDLYQDCWVTFDKCLKSFNGKTEQEFMVFFKTALFNHIKNMRRNISKEKEATEKYSQPDSEDGLESLVNLHLKLVNAPTFIKKLFEVLLSPPQSYKDAEHKIAFENNATAIAKYFNYNPRKVNYLKDFRNYILS